MDAYRFGGVYLWHEYSNSLVKTLMIKTRCGF